MNIIICQIISLYVIAVFARVILSWFPLAPGGAMSTVYGVLYNITEPVLGPLRRVLPSVGMLDLSPIVVVIVARIVQSSIC